MECHVEMRQEYVSLVEPIIKTNEELKEGLI